MNLLYFLSELTNKYSKETLFKIHLIRDQEYLNNLKNKNYNKCLKYIKKILKQ